MRRTEATRMHLRVKHKRLARGTEAHMQMYEHERNNSGRTCTSKSSGLPERSACCERVGNCTGTSRCSPALAPSRPSTRPGMNLRGRARDAGGGRCLGEGTPRGVAAARVEARAGSLGTGPFFPFLFFFPFFSFSLFLPGARGRKGAPGAPAGEELDGQIRAGRHVDLCALGAIRQLAGRAQAELGACVFFCFFGFFWGDFGRGTAGGGA